VNDIGQAANQSTVQWLATQDDVIRTAREFCEETLLYCTFEHVDVSIVVREFQGAEAFISALTTLLAMVVSKTTHTPQGAPT
jgi:hypothetical protein